MIVEGTVELVRFLPGGPITSVGVLVLPDGYEDAVWHVLQDCMEILVDDYVTTCEELVKLMLHYKYRAKLHCDDHSYVPIRKAEFTTTGGET